jgi:hypothetical protein
MIIEYEIQDASFKRLCRAISKLTDLSSIKRVAGWIADGVQY